MRGEPQAGARCFSIIASVTLGKRSLQEWRDAHKSHAPVADGGETTSDGEDTNPAATDLPVRKAANTRAWLSMSLDLKVRKRG